LSWVVLVKQQYHFRVEQIVVVLMKAEWFWMVHTIQVLLEIPLGHIYGGNQWIMLVIEYTNAESYVN
jgi:hypothetical protein